MPDSRWERNGAGEGNEEGRLGECTPVDLSYITHRHIFWISGFKLCHTVHVVCPLVECLFIYTFVWNVQAWISVQGCLYACTHNLIYIYMSSCLCAYTGMLTRGYAYRGRGEAVSRTPVPISFSVARTPLPSNLPLIVHAWVGGGKRTLTLQSRSIA